ncbi:MAG: TIM barrel protein [Bacteroidota bacterium]
MNPPTRRDALKKIGLATGSLLTLSATSACASNAEEQQATTAPTALKGMVNHSVCRWCYGDIPLEAFSEKAKDMGIQSIELTKPQDWPVLQKYGLTCAMATDDWISLTKGWSQEKYHAAMMEPYIKLIDQAAEAGLKNVICFSGNREGIGEEEGLENCAKGLEPIVKHAQKRGITMCMELLNSKVDHQDYQCDHTNWGVALAEKLGSEHFKLLYDIYHMQIMEGDVIATIRKNKDYIAHFHTGGVPGRNEIDETQELYYPAILKAIVDTGFKGFVAQEFIPTQKDKLVSLEAGIRICDV